MPVTAGPRPSISGYDDGPRFALIAAELSMTDRAGGHGDYCRVTDLSPVLGEHADDRVARKPRSAGSCSCGACPVKFGL